MVEASDENEAEGRRLTPPPSPSPSPSPSPLPPPPPIVPLASPLQATASPPTVLPMAMNGLNLADDPRLTPPASPSPSPSPEEEDDPLEQGADATAWRQGEAGLRLPVKERCGILHAPATPATRGCAAKTSANRCSIRHAAATSAPDDSTYADGDDGYYRPQAKSRAGFCAAHESSASDDDDGDDAADSARSQKRAELTLKIFRHWAQKRAPHLLPYLEPAGTHLALEHDQVALLDWQLRYAGDMQPDPTAQENIIQGLMPTSTDDDIAAQGQKKVAEQCDVQLTAASDDWEKYAIYRPKDETTRDIPAEDQEKVGSAENVDALDNLTDVHVEEHEGCLKEQGSVGNWVTFSDAAAAAAASEANNLVQDTDKVVEQQVARDDQMSAARDVKSNIQLRSASCDDIAVEDQKKTAEQCDLQLRAQSRKFRSAIYPNDDDIAADNQQKVGSAENVDALDRLTDVDVEEPDYLKEQIALGYWGTFSDATALEDQENESELCKGDKQIEAQQRTRKLHEEPIRIAITEKVEYESIGRQINSTNICGKIVVLFPPNVDRHVQFVMDQLDGIDFRTSSLVDRKFSGRFQVLRSERFPLLFELLKWHKTKCYIPHPLAVTLLISENESTKQRTKDDSFYHVEIICRPTGMADMHNVVVTIPMPRVDQTGIRRSTKTYVWKSVGSHQELEDSVEWHIPHIGAWDKRAIINVDAYCYDGCQEESQFYPIRIECSYDKSIGSKVALVARTGDGRLVDFRQETVGRWSCAIHHSEELDRRAAEAAEKALAWEEGPWDPWE